MEGKRISQLTPDTSPSTDDYIVTVDGTTGQNKRVDLGYLPVSDPQNDALDLKLNIADNRVELRGNGFPNGVVSAPVGTTYVDTAATSEITMWSKTTGVGNTGWRPIVAARPNDWSLLAISSTRVVADGKTYFEVVIPANYLGVRISFLNQTVQTVGFEAMVRFELCNSDGTPITLLQRVEVTTVAGNTTTSGSVVTPYVWQRLSQNNFGFSGSLQIEKMSTGAWGVGDYKILESAGAIKTGNIRINGTQFVRIVRIITDGENGLIPQGYLKVEVKN